MSSTIQASGVGPGPANTPSRIDLSHVTSLTGATGSFSDRRMRSSSFDQLPARSQAIIVAQARLSCGVHGSTGRPSTTNSGGLACIACPMKFDPTRPSSGRMRGP